MPPRRIEDYIRSAFEPLAAAASRFELLDSLTTADLADERRDEQYEQFKTITLEASNVAYLPGGGFQTIFSRNDGRFLAISSSSLNSTEEESLYEWARTNTFEVSLIDESTFLFMAHELKGYFRLKDSFRAPEQALNVIEVTDINQGYSGHEISDLIDYYRPVFIFRIPEDSRFSDSNIYEIGSYACCGNGPLRSHLVDEEVSLALEDLLKFDSIDKENIYLALTASQWRHAFLEIYRSVESIFFLPWVIDLKDSASITMKAVDLKNFCRSNLGWREREEASMEALFGKLDVDTELSLLENDIDIFTELLNSDDFSRKSIGRRIYKLRNSLVHHENYDGPDTYKPDDAQWRLILIYLAKSLEKIHSQFEHEIVPISKTAG